MVFWGVELEVGLWKGPSSWARWFAGVGSMEPDGIGRGACEGDGFQGWSGDVNI